MHQTLQGLPDSFFFQIYPFFFFFFLISGGAASLHKCEEAGVYILKSLKHHSGFPVLLDLRNKIVRPNP